MGAGACHHEREEDDSEASSEGETSQSEAGCSDDDRPQRPSLLTRFISCMQLRGGMSFMKATDMKVNRTGASSVPKKALLIKNEGKQLDQYFNVNLTDKNAVLGEGGYAKVCLATSKRTGEQRAVKCIRKDRIADLSRLQREVDIVMGMDHPNINKLFQTFEDRRVIYLVLELCQGGELFDRIIEEGQLTEAMAADVMVQIFRAVHYMHGNGIVHRDLKPENFLFQYKAPITGNTLKLIDFGIANTFSSPSDTFTTKTGTPYYVAPEVLEHWCRYGREVDMWACGVILFVLLSGRLPFRGKDEMATLKAVMKGDFTFPPAFDNVSKTAKSLITWLLAKNPMDRCTSAQALEDVWTKKMAPQQQTLVIQPAVITSLRQFHKKNQLKRRALHAVARQLDEGSIKELRTIFMQMDSNNDGTLTHAEIVAGLQQSGLLTNELQDLVQSMDTDNSGEVDYTEFLAATLETRQYNNEAACWAAFRVFDLNDDGRISRKELQAVLNSGQVVTAMGKEVVDEVMKEVDLNGDGFIDFDEFMAMMKK